MTKSNPRRRNRNRTDPTAKPAKLPSDPELLKLREQKILPVLKDLQSADQQLRSSAATAISNLIDDSRCRKLLLREQLVRILLEQSLTDSSLETRCAGWGILKNLAIEEEVDFCVHLYRQDILSAIERAVNSVRLPLQPNSRTLLIFESLLRLSTPDTRLFQLCPKLNKPFCGI